MIERNRFYRDKCGEGFDLDGGCELVPWSPEDGEEGENNIDL